MNQQKINVPTGDEYIIREQTGADDDLLSKLDVDEATVLNRYIAAIIISGPNEKRLTLKDVEELLLRDKYIILFKSRIFSLSDKLIFSYNWPEQDEPIEYEVDLKDYVWDYSKPFPKLGDEDYCSDMIPPYDNKEKEVTFTLTSGKVVSFGLLDGVGEKYLLGVKPMERSINKQLVARAFKVDDGSKMVTVKNFQVFSSRDMMEIRNKVDIVDPPVEGNTTIVNPADGASADLPIIGIKDFTIP